MRLRKHGVAEAGELQHAHMAATSALPVRPKASGPRQVGGHRVLQLHLGEALAGLEVVEVNQVVRLGAGGAPPGSRQLLRIPPLLLPGHAPEGGPALGGEDGKQASRGGGDAQDLEAQAEAVTAVAVHRVAQPGGGAEGQHAGDVQHRLRPCRIGLGTRHPAVGRGVQQAEAQGQLGEGTADGAAQEEVPGQQHATQVGPPAAQGGAQAGAAGCQEGGHRGGALRGGALCGIRAVRQHGWPLAAHVGRRRHGGAGAAGHAVWALARPLGSLLCCGVERRRPQGALDGGKAGVDLLVGGGVLADDPERTGGDPGRADGVEAVQQAPQDGLPQPRARLRNLADEEDDVQGGGGVGVAQELHEEVDHLARHVRELDRAAVDGLHQHLAVVPQVRPVPADLGLEQLLLEGGHHLVNVAGRHQLQRQVQRLAPDVRVRAAQGAEDVHDGVLQHLPVGDFELRQAVQHNQLHVVVAVLHQQLGVAPGGCPDGGGRVGQGHQGGGALVDDSGGVGRQQADDDLDVPPLLLRVGTTHLGGGHDSRVSGLLA